MYPKLHFTASITIWAMVLCSFSSFASHKQQEEKEKLATDKGIPKLQKNGKTTQLMVDGKPFLIIGGELNNSTSSSLAYMKPLWQHVTDLHFNTVITPLSWDLIEPEEGKFDFTLVDGLIKDARQYKMRIVFLWLASWKNGMSSYAPIWVKENYKKYPRIKYKDGSTTEVLTALSEASAEADAKAFAALMKHIREIDEADHTVLMMQIENEVGILGDSRDRSDMANKAFNAPVPAELMNYLTKNKASLVPELQDTLKKYGSKTSGTWEQVFGKSDRTDETFMAWYYAKYVNKVAEAGKKAYPIPMYTNAWLDQKDGPKPGWYPSGGPLAHLLNIWNAGAPAIDLLAPDIYVPEYEERCRKFTQAGNPLFIPEMNSGEDGARNIFIAIGQYNAIGVSPFGIDRLKDAKESAFSKSYDIIAQISPLILESQAKGEIAGFVVDEKTPVITRELGGYTVEISLDEIFGHKAKIGYGIVMADGPNKFIGAGAGFRVRFYSKSKDKTIIGIGSVDEGVFENGKWIAGRRLNGDENDQGRAWRFSSWKLNIEKCTVYKYE